MGIFRNKQIHIIAFRAPEEIIVNYPVPLVIAKNSWLCMFDDGHIEAWENAMFRAEFVPVDQAAKDALE